MPPFRDDHILIIYPGSQTTLAQLGLPESFTPAKLRIASRMFPGIEEGTWTATKIREAREGEKEDLIAKQKAAMGAEADEEEEEEEEEEGEEEGGGEGKGLVDGAGGKEEVQEDGDAVMAAVDAVEKKVVVVLPQKEEEADGDGEEEEDEDMGEEGVYVEDEDDEEGAVWCMKEGKVVDWGCFFALLQHVHETINPTFHTPILMLHPPNFSARDRELLTQFVFEKLKAPGFALMDASLAVLWAYGISSATIIDVGFEKTDITPILEFIIQERARESVPGWGGDAMTRHLAKLLPDMKPEEVEQLKRSQICEILSTGASLPTTGSVNAAIAAGEKNRKNVESDGMDLDVEDEEGTFNVAAIVASGKTHEFLAKREKERRGEFEKRLPNRDRENNTFWLVEKKKPGEDGLVIEEPLSAVATTAPPLPLPEASGEPAADAAVTDAPAPTTAEAGTTETEKPAEAEKPIDGADGAVPANPTEPAMPAAAPADEEAARRNKEKEKEKEKRKDERRAAAGGLPPLAEDETYREVEVGVERFQAAECGILVALADSIWRVIGKVEDVARRAELWESLIIVGNGSKVKGFKEALLATIQGKYFISPSSGTIFSSELPSNLSTPMATGASTPIPQGALGGPSQPNPLLVAATTHNSHQQNPYNPMMMQQQHHHHNQHSAHGQTPTTIKVVKPPEYFPEWKDVGFEEVGFLGAQVAAKVLFVVDQGASQGFLTRVEYNEGGPAAIHAI